MTKHSPAPWRVVKRSESDDYDVVGADGYTVSTHCDSDVETERANAHLVSVSPEMLDVLRELQSDPRTRDAMSAEMFERVSTVIAKAAGHQSPTGSKSSLSLSAK